MKCTSINDLLDPQAVVLVPAVVLVVRGIHLAVHKRVQRLLVAVLACAVAFAWDDNTAVASVAREWRAWACALALPVGNCHSHCGHDRRHVPSRLAGAVLAPVRARGGICTRFDVRTENKQLGTPVAAGHALSHGCLYEVGRALVACMASVACVVAWMGPCTHCIGGTASVAAPVGDTAGAEGLGIVMLIDWAQTPSRSD